MNIFSISSLLAAIFITSIGIFIYFKSARNRSSYFFLLLTISIGVLCFAQFHIRIASDLQEAILWSKVLSLWPLPLIFAIHFVYELTQRENSSTLFYLLIYIPAILIGYLQFATDLLTLPPIEKYWGWSIVFNKGIIFNISILYGVLLWLVILLYIYRYIRNSSGRLKNQGLFILLGFCLSFIVSFTSDAGFPYFNADIPELGCFAHTLSFIIAGYGVWRFDIFKFGNNTISDKLFSTISNYLILVDSKMTILEINDKLLDRLGYSRNAILGKKFSFIMENGTSGSNPISEFVNNYQEFTDEELSFKSLEGNPVQLNFSASFIRLTTKSLPGLLYVGSSENQFSINSQLLLDEKKKQVQFLAEATLDIVKFSNHREVYNYLSESLYKLLDRNAIIVCSESYKYGDIYSWDVIAMSGINDIISKLTKILGFSIKSFSASTEPNALKQLSSGKLCKLDLDIETLTNRKISKNLGNKIVKLSGIEELYSIFIQHGSKVFGTISILTKKATPKINNDLIESYMAIVSLVLKHLYAESRLAELNRQQTKLFSVIGHDIKNPLSNIIGVSDLILNDFDSKSDSTIREYISMINQTAKNGNDILDSLLEWSKSIQNLKLINNEPACLKELTSQAIEQIQTSANNKKITISNKIIEYTPVKVDKNMIITVLRNLLSNAIKFTKKGGAILIDSSINDATIKVSITDNGIGMSKEQINSLFRMDNLQVMRGTEGESGSGFGLMLCKDLVEKNGGSISAQSRKNHGSAITLLFPKPKP